MCESEDMPRCWKKNTDKKKNTTEHRPYNLNTLDGMSLSIAVRSQSWLAWLQDLWKFGSGWERWHRQKHSHWQSGRQTARRCASQTDSLQRRLPQHPVLASYLSLSLCVSLPIPVVIHQDRSSLPLLSVQTEIMNQQYEERQRREKHSMSRGVKSRRNVKRW